jgi:hypothetical protein
MGFALRELLAVVGSAPSVRPGLADGDLMCMTLLRWRLPASEESLWRTTSLLEASTGAVPESKKRSEPWGREACHVVSPVAMILAASMGPPPKISVRVLPPKLPPLLRCSRLGARSCDPAPGGRPGHPKLAAHGGGLKRLGTYAAQDVCGSVDRKRSGYSAGEEVS